MSTRSILGSISNEKGKKWEGVYCHWDGYPTNRGSQIWDILHKQFINNEGDIGVQNTSNITGKINAFLKIYVDGHKGGWSSFPDQCYCHDPSFVMRDGVHENLINDKGAKDSWCEYAYILDPEKATMTIYCSYKSWTKPIAVVDLLGKEPDWKKIEDSTND